MISDDDIKTTYSPMNLEELVKEFFSILDEQEESDSGRVFSPTFISTVRVVHTIKLQFLLPLMRQKSNVNL